MSGYISREMTIEYLMTNMGWHDEDGYPVDDADEKRKIITDLISGIPAADVRPVVRGEWEWEMYQYTPHCSVCGGNGRRGPAYETKFNFCPWCGADMRKEKGE